MWKPTFLEIPTISETIFYNYDQNLWLWKDPFSGKWTISNTLYRRISISGGGSFLTDYQSYRDKIFYYESGALAPLNTTKDVHFQETNFWVISRTLGGGMAEWWDDQDGEYKGDIWYSKGGAMDGSYVARGRNRGSTQGAYEGTPRTLTINDIYGWESDTLFGEYSAIAGGGASGKKYVGWKKLTGNNGLGDLIATPIEQNGQKVFSGDLSLWFDGANWIINSTPGTKDSDIGYWQGGTPPTPSSTTTIYNLVYTGEEPDPTPASYTLTFDSYIGSDNYSEEIQGQIAVFL